jgi:hypothetical protein
MSDYNDNIENPESQEEKEQKKKLTDMQLRYVQTGAGILCAAALVFSLFFMQYLAETSSLLQYSFLIVFLAITFGRRSIENKYRIRLNLFGLVLLDGIAAGILLYLLITPIELDMLWKLVILIGGTVLLLGLGVLWPYLRYRKRVENGTLPPIRLPEKKEEEKSNNIQEPDSGHMTSDQKIAAMMRELEEQKNNEEQK